MSDKKKILVVDDEEDQRTFMCTLLEDNGYETICAIDGEEGMDKVKEDKPDLITLDISMDNQSGIKMFRTLHKDPETKDIPVIMVTGVAAEFKTFIERQKQVDPPDAYFEKPIEQADFLKKVKELI